MKTHLCTLFDSNFLTRGLALYRSLVKTGEDFVLYVYCMDDSVFELLKKLALPGIEPVCLVDFETPALLDVKKTRSAGEYCWTCTPWITRDALERFHLNEITYLDADLYFFASPSLLLKEFHRTNASVLITEHRYTPEYDQSAESGTYCVQFMTFKNDEHGRLALNWWADRCLEWCYARNENGKFGDQKYLDDWTTRFAGVHVLKHLGGGVAPWNVQQYQVTSGPRVDGTPVVFYHFHKLVWFSSDFFDLCASGYRMGTAVKEFIYRPYTEELKNIATTLRSVAPEAVLGQANAPKGLRPKLRAVKRMMKGTYSVIK